MPKQPPQDGIPSEYRIKNIHPVQNSLLTSGACIRNGILPSHLCFQTPCFMFCAIMPGQAYPESVPRSESLSCMPSIQKDAVSRVIAWHLEVTQRKNPLFLSVFGRDCAHFSQLANPSCSSFFRPILAWKWRTSISQNVDNPFPFQQPKLLMFLKFLSFFPAMFCLFFCGQIILSSASLIVLCWDK